MLADIKSDIDNVGGVKEENNNNQQPVRRAS